MVKWEQMTPLSDAEDEDLMRCEGSRARAKTEFYA